MAYPDKYSRLYDYVAYQNTNPTRPLPATKVHADLNSLAEISDDTVEFLKLFTRADGALANGSVGYDQLSASLQTAGIAPAEAWVTATSYVVGNSVTNGGSLYRCLVSHTSGVFADDLASAKWTLVAVLPTEHYLAGTGLQLNTLTFSIDATVATLSGVQVLTNKTINGSNNTISNLSLSMFAAGAFGTGVAAALAVNVGSAGAPVLFNGALGTPISGTLTNCTIPVTQILGFGAGGATFLGTPSSANLAAFLTDETGSGAAVFGTSPTLTTPNIVGSNGTTDATAGSVGEYIESNIASGSAIAAGATGVSKNLTSISLTAGDWDVTGMIAWVPAATTQLTAHGASISLTTGTADVTLGRNSIMTLPSAVVGAGNTSNSNVVMPSRIKVSSTTTVFLVGTAIYATSTLNMYGNLRARRVR